MTNRPGADGLLRERVTIRLEEAGRTGLLREEFADLATDPEELNGALRRLEERGRAVELEGRWFAARHVDGAVGTVERLETGDALIVLPGAPGAKGAAGYFVGRRRLQGAAPGDTVLVRRVARKKVRGQNLPEAEVVKILGQRYKTIVGTIEADARGFWLMPFDAKVALDLAVDGAAEVPPGHYVVVAVERHKPGRPPRGRVIEVLGDPDVPGVDVEIVLRHHGIVEAFPDEVLEVAAAFPADPRPEDWAGREDLRGRTIVTIDGPTARDFDDAISIERLPIGGFRLGVHIADVSAYVREGTILDAEAYLRGTSVYYPERAIPMLPEGLSNGLCSLRPNVPRLTLSAFLDLAEDGSVRTRRFAATVIQSSRRLTYDEARRLIEEPRPDDGAEYGPVLPALRAMHELMQVLNAARRTRGSIDFDLPEGDVQLDTDGVMVGVLPEERNVAHRLVEEFMIAANEAVAEELETRGIPALYRVHDAPGRARLQELADLLESLGIELKGDFDNLHPEVLQEVLEKAKGHPEEHFVSTVVLRTMQRAFYAPECRGHYALASRYYTHFTSPIRRYPDLLVHRALKALIDGRVQQLVDSSLAERLPAMAEHTSSTERRAEQSERDLLQWKKVRFLAGRVGERFTGRITGVQPFGLFVQLDNYYVDGLVPIRTLGDDFYRFEPEAHRLVGERAGEVFRLADPIEVELVGVALRHRGLDFRRAASGKTRRRS